MRNEANCILSNCKRPKWHATYKKGAKGHVYKGELHVASGDEILPNIAQLLEKEYAFGF